jgi:hypothetical protein
MDNLQHIVKEHYTRLFLHVHNDIDIQQKELFKAKLNKLYQTHAEIEFFKKFIDSIHMYAFIDFIEHILTAYSQFCQSVDEYVLVVQQNDDIKSNYWVSLLLMCFCMATTDTEIHSYLNHYMALHRKDFSHLILQCKMPIDIAIVHNNDFSNIECNRTYLLCDDASYSGSQILSHINEMMQYTFNINVVLGAVSNRALGEIDSISNCYYGAILQTFSELHPYIDTSPYARGLRGDCSINTVCIYEHKLADHVSTYPFFILGRYNESYVLDTYNKTMFVNCTDDDPVNTYLYDEVNSILYAFYKISLAILIN